MKDMNSNELSTEFRKLTKELALKIIPLIESVHPVISGHCFNSIMKALIRDAYLNHSKEMGLNLKNVFIKEMDNYFNDLENGKIK